jgi:ComF family protein
MRASGAAMLGDIDFVVPVPLHWRREHQRGFNQAAELARFLGPPVRRVLVRRRHTPPQIELAAHQRRANVRDAFGLRRSIFRKAPSVKGANVLLVDDVSTTGATLEACARVLKDAGASEVYALTAARVVAIACFSRSGPILNR